MKKLLLTSAMIAALSAAMAADANAFTRTATGSGPRGTSTVTATGQLRQWQLLAQRHPGPVRPATPYTRTGTVSR